MAMSALEELLKRLGLGGAGEVAQASETGQRPLEEVMGVEKPKHRPSILNMFSPEDSQDETSARRRALLQAGAQMMAASGPSYEPKNLFSIAGQGLSAGLQGYDSSLDSAQTRLLTGAKVAANDQKLQAAQNAATFGATIGGGSGSGGAGAVASAGNGMGYSDDQLMQIYKHLMAQGEYAEANKVLGMIQELRKTAAGKGMVVGEDGALQSAPGFTDGLQRNSRAEDEGKYTADRKNWEFYRDQQIAKGEPYEDFDTWNQKTKESGSTKVNVSSGVNGSKYDERSAEEAAKRHGDIVADAQNAPNMIGDMDMLMELGRKVQTGKMAEFKLAVGPYAEALGMSIEGLGPAQAYQAIINRLTPNMRPAGAGSSSDMDVRMYMQSLPNLANTDDGNEVIAVTMKAVQQNKLEAAQIARSAQKGEITWQEADSQIAALPNPYQRFKEYMAEKKAAGETIKQSMNLPNDGASADMAAIPTVTTKEEYDALPSGASFKRNGRLFKKP